MVTSRQFLLACGLGLGLSAALNAQASMPPLPEPQPASVPRVPAHVERRLPNGMQLRVVSDPRATLVTMALVFPGGSALLDPVDRAGVGILLNSLLDQAGSDSLGWQDMTNAFLSLGALPTIAVTDDAATVQYTVVPANLERAARLTAHLLRRVRFDSTTFEARRATIQGNVAARRSRAPEIANTLLDVATFGPAHPYGRPFLPPSVARIGFADVQRLHADAFRPEVATIIVAGGVSADVAERAMRAAFGDWRRDARSTAPEPYRRGDPRVGAPSSQRPRVVLVDYPGASQSQLRIGSMNLIADDRVAGQVLTRVLTSVLFSRLRTENGYAYDAFASYRSLRLADRVQQVAAVETSKTDSALTLMLAIMDDMRNGRFDSTLVQSAKDALKESMRERYATSAGTAASFANVVSSNLASDHFERYVQRIDAVQVADLQRVARQVFAPERFVVLVAGDLARVRAGVERLRIGPVQEWDADGRVK